MAGLQKPAETVELNEEIQIWFTRKKPAFISRAPDEQAQERRHQSHLHCSCLAEQLPAKFNYTVVICRHCERASFSAKFPTSSLDIQTTLQSTEAAENAVEVIEDGSFRRKNECSVVSVALIEPAVVGFAAVTSSRVSCTERGCHQLTHQREAKQLEFEDANGRIILNPSIRNKYGLCVSCWGAGKKCFLFNSGAVFESQHKAQSHSFYLAKTPD
ncbi:hypothetical protein R1flu_009708 [Riccia fluitans]|uniref:Uncharacterized protein n=1 Tax=Riccia fluitans TaxID=41844 RepID=A0ABD1Z391_9MARC